MIAPACVVLNVFDRTDRSLMNLINNQLARPTGRQGAEAFRPLGWMLRGIDRWEADQTGALVDLRGHARQGVLDLYEFLIEQPATFSCSTEEFILGYKPVLTDAVPPEHASRLQKWYRAVGTVFGWLDVPQGDSLTVDAADSFQVEIGAAIADIAAMLVPAQEAWSRIRARLG